MEDSIVSSQSLTPHVLTSQRRLYPFRSWLLAVGVVTLTAFPAQASRPRRVAVTPTPPPQIQIAAMDPELTTSERIQLCLALALIVIAAGVFLFRRSERKERERKAEIQAFEESIRASDEELSARRLENSNLKCEVTSLSDQARRKDAALLTVSSELSAVQSRLALLLDANPGAEDRMAAKSKRDAEVMAAEKLAQEVQERARQGEARVQALLHEMKRGR